MNASKRRTHTRTRVSANDGKRTGVDGCRVVRCDVVWRDGNDGLYALQLSHQCRRRTNKGTV